MAAPVKQLPWELQEEILSRLPLQALFRSRTVCKQWNSLFNDKSFLKNHFSRSLPQFIFVTASKVYSIDVVDFDPNSINPTIELCELPSFDFPFKNRYLKVVTNTACDEFLFCNYNCKNKSAIWNPWLRQVTWINHKDNQFNVVGLGYDNSEPKKIYKMLVWYSVDNNHKRVKVYECASHAFKSIGIVSDDDWKISFGKNRLSYVPLNGNLYWVTYSHKTCEYFIQSFDFSRENFKPLCLLPCQQNHDSDKLLLAVFEGDRFSLLKLCYETRNIRVWVTKKSNNGDDGEGVVWISLMTLSATNLPTLFCNMSYRRISYIIYNKSIFMCSDDGKSGVACIYIVKEDLCKKIPIRRRIVNFFNCVYVPNLISIPSFI